MTEDKYYYDHVAAQIVVNFCEKLIVHIKVEWKKKDKKEIQEVAKTLDKPKYEKDKSMTLLEKLKEKTVNIDNPISEDKSKDETVKEEPKEEKPEEPKEKIVTKVDFLKGFKEHDPDDDKGKEKKDLKISLTSKK